LHPLLQDSKMFLYLTVVLLLVGLDGLLRRCLAQEPAVNLGLVLFHVWRLEVAGVFDSADCCLHIQGIVHYLPHLIYAVFGCNGLGLSTVVLIFRTNVNDVLGVRVFLLLVGDDRPTQLSRH
jgi:hypothetical protein